MAFWQNFTELLKGELKNHFSPVLAQFESKMGPAVLEAAEKTVAEIGEAAQGQGGLTMAQLPAAIEATAKKLADQGITVAEPLVINALQAAAAQPAPKAEEAA